MLRLRGQTESVTPDIRDIEQSTKPAPGTFLKFLKGEIVYDQGDPATHWYEVISGTVRTCYLYADGHRQLTGFFYSGDVFGIELGHHQSSAEAVTNLVLRRIGRASQSDGYAFDAAMISPSAAGLPSLSQNALESALNNAQACILLLGHRTAAERLAAFLLATSRRLSAEKPVHLPMSRADIADHLGLTVHTVSRTLSDFVRRALIILDGPQTVHILDREALMREAGREQEDTEIPFCRPYLVPPAGQNSARPRSFSAAPISGN
jgi:CRP/FNR family transcriptional regulator, nitrogen fixation regulation protein